MGAALVFHAAVRAPALHDEGDVFDAALRRLVAIQFFDFPAFIVGVAAIHAEEFAREKRRLASPPAPPWMVTRAFLWSRCLSATAKF